MNPFAIRQYQPSDLVALYGVCLGTGADGGDARGKIDGELLGDVYLGPYCELQPESAFVLTRDEVPVGYIVGAVDTRQFLQRCEAGWWPALRKRYRASSAPDSWTQRVINEIHRVDEPPHFVAEYPAHLHINILPVAQGVGQGRALMDYFVDYLRGLSVPGVHLGVSRRNARAIAFYRRYGFIEIEGSEAGLHMGLGLSN
ncbi:MAG: GNAT family N-acetyltransferase [Pseudomonadales bacterium]